MEKETTTLGGFEAIFGGFDPNAKANEEQFDDDILAGGEELDDDALDAIKNQTTKTTKTTKVTEEPEDDEEDDEVIEEPVKTTKKTKKNEVIVNGGNDDIDIVGTAEDGVGSELITGFFDAISERLGWEFGEDEEKPTDVDSLLDYFQTVIEENSKPDYASEEVAALDEYVKNGGDIRKYLSIDAEVDYDNIDITDERNQKTIIKAFLKEKGMKDTQIERRLTRYEDSGVLEEEAEDALESMKEIVESKKQQLLADQKKAADTYRENQQRFYNSVVEEVKNLNDIRGIKVPAKDKEKLLNYLLKPEADGKTRYYKEYSSNVRNMIESAYFTMNRDKMLEQAEKKGNNSAIEKFKNSLKNTTVRGAGRSMRSNNNDLWSSVVRGLRAS